jgi:hypothetical protein
MEGGGIEAPEWEEPAVASTSGGEGGVIFVLENANLETAKVGKNYELLNCDDHANFLRRHKKDPALYRPDICHQARGQSAGVPAELAESDRASSSRKFQQGGKAGLQACWHVLPVGGVQPPCCRHRLPLLAATRHPCRPCLPSWTAH